MRLILLFILSIHLNAFAQIEYHAVFIDPCNELEVNLYYWWVEKNGIRLGTNSFSDKPIHFTNPGVYYIKGPDIQNDSIQVTIRNSSVQRDTFYVSSLKHAIYVSNPAHDEYYYCDSLANGTITDYHYNGNIYFEGQFKNGQLVDSIRFYYQDGTLKQREVIIPNRYIFELYYDNGQLKRIISGSELAEKEFYPSGQLKSEHKWTRKYRRMIRNTYYPNGTLKTHTTEKIYTEYWDNGQLLHQFTHKRSQPILSLFTPKKNNSYGKYYDYNWISYINNEPVREVNFTDHKLDYYTTKDLSTIGKYSLNQITYNVNNVELYRINRIYILLNNILENMLITEKKVNGNWEQTGQFTFDELIRLDKEMMELVQSMND